MSTATAPTSTRHDTGEHDPTIKVTDALGRHWVVAYRQAYEQFESGYVPSEPWVMLSSVSCMCFTSGAAADLLAASGTPIEFPQHHGRPDPIDANTADALRAAVTAMADKRRQAFVVSIEARHAKDLRAERDLSDADIAANFISRLTPDDIARERGKATHTRIYWERDAAQSALAQAIDDYMTSISAEHQTNEGTLTLPARDLDGLTVSVTVRDLIATATLAL